jgi:hypothetical protein
MNSDRVALGKFVPEKMPGSLFALIAKAAAIASRPEIIRMLGYDPTTGSPLFVRNLGSGTRFET